MTYGRMGLGIAMALAAVQALPHPLNGLEIPRHPYRHKGHDPLKEAEQYYKKPLALTKRQKRRLRGKKGN